MKELTYPELLKITWYITWRNFLLCFGPLLVFYIVCAIVGVPFDRNNPYWSLIGFIFLFFVAYPLTIHWLVRDRFVGFRLQVVRGI